MSRFPFGWDLPPGVTDRMIDEASPGYWDEPEEEEPEPPANIIVTHEPPPIPMRRFDYCAVRGDWDLGDPMGFGATEEEAIADLLAEEELRDER